MSCLQVAEGLVSSIPPKFADLDAYIGKHMKNGFAVGGEMSICDVHIYITMGVFEDGPRHLMPKGVIKKEDYPNIMAVVNTMATNPKVIAFQQKYNKA